MRVLVACEESQRVCAAFRERGHEAFSCDILPCGGGYPEWHIKDDVLKYLNGNCMIITQNGTIHYIDGEWDLIIGHPPCTYLSNAGANSLFKKINGKTYMNYERYKKGVKGKEFFMKILNANCEKIAVENPIPSRIYELPQYTQVIQPYDFGHPVSKKTCLWLKGLPPLMATDIVEPEKGRKIKLKNGKVRNSCWTMNCGKPFGGEDRARERSKTFPGIAKAMAEQWG